MSRGWNFNSNLQYVENKIIFSQRDISITLRMYYNLWLYYHRAGYNKQFTTKLHKLLRDDRMKFGGEGWYQGEKYGGDRGTADNSWLKFYEKACGLQRYHRLAQCHGEGWTHEHSRQYVRPIGKDWRHRRS